MNRKAVRYNMMNPIVCEQHFEHGPLDCCPFPDCPNGTDADEIEAAAPHLESKIYRRAIWTDADGQNSYSWMGDLPLWFSLSRVVWRDATRKLLIGKNSATLQPTVYHYTSPEGLLGIVETGELWMSDYSYLNDAEELTYGLRLAKQRFDLIADVTPSAASVLRKWGGVIETMQSRVCVCSFSSDGDSLSQWRAYGPLAIGFRVGGLMFGYANTTRMQPVVYEPDTQRQLFDLMACYCASAYINDAATISPKKLAQLYEDGSDRNLELTAFLKHPTFSDEREIRMVHVENPRIFDGSLPAKPAPYRFRTSRGFLMPYVTTRDVVALPDSYPVRLPISEIVIGPYSNADMLEHGVKVLLKARGYEGVAVRRSTAPLR